MKKLLIVGYNGQLGSELTRIIEGKNNMAIVKWSSKDLDITQGLQVLSSIRNIEPDIIINCAAYTNVDQAEEDYEKAFQVNALGPRNLAIAAEAVGAKLVHISTDYVFDGKGVIVNDNTMPYREYDMPKPINVYGKSKLLGENYVRDFCSRYFIIRTAWLYGENGSNFVKTIIKAAKEKGRLQVVNDQLGNPTNAEDLAKHIIKIALTEDYGIYHCTGSGIASWYDFACRIVEYAGIDCIVEPVTSEQYARKAKRPSYSCLDNMMLRSTIGDNMRDWEEALVDFIKNRMRF